MTKVTGISRMLASLALAGAAAGAQAAPVVYTLRTVTDGQLGRHAFNEAIVEIRMVADTSTVVQTAGSNGGSLYVNKVGRASVSITSGGVTRTANFDPGQIYVRYDAGAGIAGFGSDSVGPTYPLTLGCNDLAFPSTASYTQDCIQGTWGPTTPYDQEDGTANALASTADGFTVASWFTSETLALPATLARSTLLTGHLHACATTYTTGYGTGLFNEGDGYLQTCSGSAPVGLHTDEGDFFVQDQVGGSTTSGPYGWSGWYTSNGGWLRVEVLK